MSAWSSSTEQSATLPESEPIGQTAMDKPISPLQEKLVPKANLIKLFKKAQLDPPLDERPGDKVGPRAGDVKRAGPGE